MTVVWLPDQVLQGPKLSVFKLSFIFKNVSRRQKIIFIYGRKITLALLVT